MPDDEKEVLIRIREQLAEIKTELKNLNNLSLMATEARDTAREAMQSTRSAHHRIDDLKEEDIKELKDNQRWLWRFAISSLITALSAAIGLIFTLAKLKIG